MGRNKVMLNVRVTPSKKEEWKSQLGEGEFLNELVRRAVDRELNDEYVHVSTLDTMETGTTDSVETEHLESEIQDLKNTIAVLSSKIDGLGTSTSKNTEGEFSEFDIEDLALDLINYLPAHPQDTPRDAGGITDGTDDREAARILIEASRQTDTQTLDGRAERLAGMRDVPVWQAREALNYLEYETTERVVSVSMPEGRHWMRL